MAIKDVHSLGLAIVGFGCMGYEHSQMLESVSEINIVGVYDILSGRQKYARSLGYHAFDSYEDLLADTRVDIVLVATPNYLHKCMSIQALEARKHVICEKPVTLSAAELGDILGAAKQCDRVFVVFQNRRWDEDFRSVKKVFDEGCLGRIFTVESRVAGSQGVPGDWRTKKRYGGGMLLDWGVHLADQLLWMIPGKIRNIYCKLGYVLGGECDDSVKLLLSFENGIEALIEVGTWNMESLHRWYMAGLGGAMSIRDLSFTESSLTLLREDVPDGSKAIRVGKGISKTMVPRNPDTLEYSKPPYIQYDVRDFYRNVVAAIYGLEELIVDPRQSLRLMRLMDAARLSAERNAVMGFE